MKGAQILFNCSANAADPGDELQPHTHLVMYLVTGSRAVENTAYVASANLAGKDKTKFFYGQSTIAGPSFPRAVRIYAESGADEEVITATLSLDQLRKARQTLPFLKHRETYSSALILQELKRLSS